MENILMEQIIMHCLAAWLISYLPAFVKNKEKTNKEKKPNHKTLELGPLATLTLLDILSYFDNTSFQ